MDVIGDGNGFEAIARIRAGRAAREPLRDGRLDALSADFERDGSDGNGAYTVGLEGSVLSTRVAGRQHGGNNGDVDNGIIADVCRTVNDFDMNGGSVDRQPKHSLEVR